MLVSRLEILNETHPASKKHVLKESVSLSSFITAMNNKVETDLIPITFNVMSAI